MMIEPCKFPLGRRVMAMIEDLAQHTDEYGSLTRLYLSPAHRAAADTTLDFMREAGLKAHIDALGSVVGRLEGANPDAPALLIGSHIDSVVDAGRYDGNLGVVLGIVVAEALKAEGITPSCPIEIVAFGDEENVRFPTNLSTSYALAGRYDPAWLDGRDADGISLRDALLEFGGLPHVGDPYVMLIQRWSGRQLGSRDQDLWCRRPVAQR